MSLLPVIVAVIATLIYRRLRKRSMYWHNEASEGFFRAEDMNQLEVHTRNRQVGGA